MNFFQHMQKCLHIQDPLDKVSQVQVCYQTWGHYHFRHTMPVEPIGEPGRPDKPELVAPKNVVHRKISTPEGLAAMVHAIAHIEFNAINLGLDAAYRFRDMPLLYYQNWLQVAAEEAHHFSLLQNFLQSLGYTYGDFPAHHSLWEMAQETAYDVLVRMALVPRVMEARGLDVTPGIIQKFKQQGCLPMVDILNTIMRDEVRHVAIGTYWFQTICEQRGLSSLDTFAKLINQHCTGQIKGPFMEALRMEAGFTEAEMQLLTKMTS